MSSLLVVSRSDKQINQGRFRSRHPASNRGREMQLYAAIHAA